MNATLRSILRSVGAVIAGFAVITLGTLFTFLVLVPDFGYYTGSTWDLTLGTVGALLSGIGGGWVAARLAARRPLLHAAALVIPIGLDTASFLSTAGPGADPVWFDLAGSPILWAGALMGGWWVARRSATTASATRSSASGVPASG
jgi:hypothetical protein